VADFIFDYFVDSFFAGVVVAIFADNVAVSVKDALSMVA
jgi:hypothetical protein